MATRDVVRSIDRTNEWPPSPFLVAPCEPQSIPREKRLWALAPDSPVHSLLYLFSYFFLSPLSAKPQLLQVQRTSRHLQDTGACFFRRFGSLRSAMIAPLVRCFGFEKPCQGTHRDAFGVQVRQHGVRS